MSAPLSPEQQALWLLAQDFASLAPLADDPVNRMVACEAIYDKKPHAQSIMTAIQENVASFETPSLPPISPLTASSVSEPTLPSEVTFVPIAQQLSASEAPQSRATAAPLPEWKELAAVSTLAELAQMMNSFDACVLKKTAMHTVFSDGNPEAKIMVIGEAPGADEDRQGRPFVGSSGKLMDNFFATIGLSREKNLYITNVIPWRPPGNRPPTPFEIAQCLPLLHHHIRLIAPKLIIMMGGTAVKALMGPASKIADLRGVWTDLSIPTLERPVPAMPLYHPAYLLRSPGNKAKVWQDLQKIKETVAIL